LCFASTLAHSRLKFDPRAIKCVFLGYPFAIKGYKLLDLHSKRIFISRDVTFYESIFPFQSIPSSTSPSSFDPLSQICTLDALPLPISDPIQHSKSVPLVDCSHPSSEHVSDPEFNIHEDNFFDLLEDLSVYLPDDIVDDPILHPNPLPSSMPIPSSVPSLRRSARVSKPPIYLQSYKCNTFSTRYPIANYVSHKKLSLSYSHFCNSISALKESQLYHQAVGDPNWEAVMAVEIEALEQNHIWSLVPLPPNKRVVGCKLVF